MRRRLRFRPRRLGLAGQGSGKGRKIFLQVTIMFIIIAGISLYFESQLAPIAERLALAKVNYLAGKAINDAINDQIIESRITYDDFIDLEKDVDGRITALKTNMLMINRFKAEVIGIVLDKIHGIDATELGVPIGNVLNGELFSGRGPKIPLKIVPVGTADARFISVFTSAGINQSRHQIIVEIEVQMGVLLPGFSSFTEVTSQVNIADTIIIGNVPDTYTYLEDTGRSGMDIYGDFDLGG